jgi:hypothetical protein
MTGDLHLFQCSQCRTTATCTVFLPDKPIECVLCRRWMKRLYSRPIVTDADRALAARGLVFNPYHASPPKHHCTTCRTLKLTSELINLAAAGYACSDACADIAVARHEQYQQRLQAEQAAERRRQQPWKYPQKESA